jgi:predicted transcriptional regulator
MGKTKLTGKLVHLDPQRAAMLEELARKSGIKQSVLMRAAIEALLRRNGYEWDREPAPDRAGRVHILRKKRKP